MVENESINVPELDLEEVVREGSQIGSKNYRFSKIGEPVPILNGDSKFDPQSPPSCPLAVSQHFRLLFVAHSTGFCVARTQDIIKSAEAMKEEAKCSSIQELCIVDVPLGKVSILALSANSSTLAASIGSHLHLFSVTDLLNKERKPLFSFSPNDSRCIKDLRWSTRLDDHYLVLSSDGKLCHGIGHDDVKDVMDEVEAVDWSVDGKFMAVARKNVVHIVSSKIEEKLRIRLSLKSLFGDSDADCVIKVDSIRWVRPDSVIVGCYQLTDDGEEENYLVQIITSKHGKITDASSSPVMLTFSDVFPCLSDPTVTFGSGPHMCLSYLDTRELAFTANRRNMDQHIVLFGWAVENNSEVAVIEIVNDSWLPRIESQGNGDDNLVLGLSLDEVSYDENVKFICGEEDKEVSPCCIVLCVTIDGKLSMFHFASAAGLTVPPKVAYSVSDEEDNNHPMGSSEYRTPISTSDVGRTIDGTNFGLNSDKLELGQLNRKGGSETPINIIEPVKTEASSDIFREIDQQKAPLETFSHASNARLMAVSVKEGGNTEQTKASRLMRSEKHDHAEVRPLVGSSSGHLSSDISNNTLHGGSLKESMAGTGLSEQLGSTSFNSTFPGFHLSEALISSKSAVDRNLSLSNAGLLENQSVGGLTTTNFSEHNSSYFNKTGPSTQSTRSQVNENYTMRTSSNSKSQFNFSNQRTHIPTGQSSSELNLSKQIHSVEEMAKELDLLMECIERPGGFNDKSIAHQKMSVASLEEGIWALSDKCRTWMERIDQRFDEIQLLPDKMVQVLARKNYLEGIVKQATDSQYLDLWNRQKLSSELEIKYRHILDINQNLTNQLIELERHLNSLELKAFGEKDGLEINHRSIQKHGPPRHVHSFHSLHNTMTAQLVAAEQLSEYLSEQMAVLGIESTPLRKQSIRKELFEAIGISHDDATFSPSDREKAGSISSKKELLPLTYSGAANSRSTRIRSSSRKNYEPETARRRRDSLGQSWASFEPPRTTVKRMLLQEDHQVSPSSISASIVKRDKMQDGSALSRSNQVYASTFKHSTKNKVNQEAPIKQIPGTSLNSSFMLANYCPDLSEPLGGSAFSSGSMANSRNSPLISKTSRSHLIPTEKTVSSTSNNCRSSQESESNQYLEQPSPVPRRFESAIKSREFSDSCDKSVLPPSFTGNGKQRPAVNDTSSFLSETTMDPSLPTISGAGSSSFFSEYGSQCETSTSASQLGEVVPFSSTLSISHSAISLELPSLIAPSPSSTATPSRLCGSSGVKVDANQTFALSASSPAFPSTTSLAAEQLISPSVSNVNLDLKSHKTEKNVDDNSSPEASVPNMISKLDGKPPPKSMFPADTSILRFETSIQSMPSNEPSSSSLTGSRLSFGIATTPVMNILSNIKSEQQHVSQPTMISSSGIGPGGKNNLDNELTQEDEMEEEVPETTQLSLTSLSGFGIGSAPNSAVPKTHPFGVSFGDQAKTPISLFPMTAPTGGLFRPASFNIQSPQLSQPSQQNNLSGFPGGFNSGGAIDQSGTGKVFGQPAQIGSGQQALGSVLGAFGQSRQLGTGQAGISASASAFGSGFVSNQSGGGFSNIGAGGGFAAAAPSTGGGGFASMASAGRGFGGVTPASGGFSAVATGAGGFAGASASGFTAAGGFGVFSNQGGSGPFSAFGGDGGRGRPPSELFTQMRK